MTFLAVEKVQTIPNLLDRDRVLLCVMLEDQLLEVQESTFVRHFLSHLDEGFPSVFGGEFCAVRALAVLDEVLNFECLFQDRVR
jgi:hypothetical protein